jgi:hypothetical protein
MSLKLTFREHRVLEFLDDHPDGLHADQISGFLQGVGDQDDIQELLTKGFLERTKDGRIRTLGRFFPLEGGGFLLVDSSF